MRRHKHITAALCVAVLATGATRAAADMGDIVGGVIGGAISGAIISNAQKKRTVKKVYRKPAVDTAQRAQNRQVQTALNYFGFPAGTPDGIMGRNSRAAVSNYQAYLGYPATGQLTQFERDFLLRSHSRAQAGGFATQQMVASLPDGQRGLLAHYRSQEARSAAMVPAAPQVMQAPPGQTMAMAPVAGGAAAGYVATTTVVTPAPAAPAPAPAAVTPPAPAPADPAPAEAPVEAAAPAAPAVPNFLAGSQETSVTAHCNVVNLRTSSSGGFVQVSSLSDPKVALDEQFCLARTYAIAQGDSLVSKVQGVTPAQIEAQCAQFGGLLKDQIAALSFKRPEAMSGDVEQFVVSSGVPPEQLRGTAQICLAVGYRTDDINTVLASAMLLTVLGDKPYAELLGHHMLNGFGVSRREDLALAWYATAIDALGAGATPVFNPGMPERQDLIKASVGALSGTDGANLTTPPATTNAAAVPAFSIAQ